MRSVFILFVVFFLVSPLAAEPFTYQGQLQQSGQPSGGSLAMTFRLYDSLTAGEQIGPEEAFSEVFLVDGLFQVELDFGNDAFDGSTRYLEIDVAGTTLSPRQKITAIPNAQMALGVAAGAVGGNQIAPGAVGTAQADSSQIQLRVSGTCEPGSALAEVTTDGSVVCSDYPAAPVRVIWVAAAGDNTFPSLSAALASITDNSASTPYLIRIAPGTYTERSMIGRHVKVQTTRPDQGLMMCPSAGSIRPSSMSPMIVWAADRPWLT